ncbi:hypothetical protein H2201_002330 [Coniosporium apollinis]|uniref:Stress-response A/B barrel domain-containing protein n=2 Tax=Coniosporium TaxID=2810619 RepID=A0ABQ9P506_9PEZI|nr:hypothetical protein H2199_001909 [Cladosporium sp. JES 115]KAJ9667462.1 hypothetical protein H2201_002330 [Coniosporium apollinis]
MTETITHIVLFKYRPDISWTDFESHFSTFLALQTRCLHPSTGKPYMLSLRAGKNRSWEPFSKGMTHGFVLEFANQEDLDYYLTSDPVHLAFSKAAGPLIEDSVVVDIRDGILFGSPAKRPGTGPGNYSGSCHCGQMAWTANLGTAEHVLCHCETCRKLGGGPYSCNQIIPREDLSITRGEPRVYVYKGASGKDVRCYFCGTCTSHIYHHQDVMPDKVIVRTLLLDGGDKMPATGEIFAEGRLGWVKELQESLVNGAK